MKYSLGIIGAGNMAHAIVKGVLQFLPADKIIISDIDSDLLKNYEAMGLKTTISNQEVAMTSDYIIFAVKPQFAKPVFAEIKGKIAGKRVISIMAGITTAQIKSALGADIRIARIMPNTPCMIAKGMSAAAFENFSDAEQKFVLSIFNNMGKTLLVKESKMDAVTSVSGSGPAYMYLFLQAIIEEGVAGGLTFEEARLLAVETMIGGAEMCRNSKDLDGLIDAVSSKGGTTVQAINYFRENNLPEIIKKGVEKCRLRSIELSENS